MQAPSDAFSIVALAFSVVFWVVGILRVVEFQGIGIEGVTRKILVALHLLGCTIFSGSMALFALDPHQEFATLLHVLFGGGLFILFPVHIFAALKRRVLQSRPPSEPH